MRSLQRVRIPLEDHHRTPGMRQWTAAVGNWDGIFSVLFEANNLTQPDLDELCTFVPPSRTRAPMGTRSWFSLWIARASSYVVPPIMNTMTSCGLLGLGDSDEMLRRSLPGTHCLSTSTGSTKCPRCLRRVEEWIT